MTFLQLASLRDSEFKQIYGAFLSAKFTEKQEKVLLPALRTLRSTASLLDWRSEMSRCVSHFLNADVDWSQSFPSLVSLLRSVGIPLVQEVSDDDHELWQETARLLGICCSVWKFTETERNLEPECWQLGTGEQNYIILRVGAINVPHYYLCKQRGLWLCVLVTLLVVMAASARLSNC